MFSRSRRRRGTRRTSPRRSPGRSRGRRGRRKPAACDGGAAGAEASCADLRAEAAHGARPKSARWPRSDLVHQCPAGRPQPAVGQDQCRRAARYGLHRRRRHELRGVRARCGALRSGQARAVVRRRSQGMATRSAELFQGRPPSSSEPVPRWRCGLGGQGNCNPQRRRNDAVACSGSSISFNAFA